MVVGCDQPPLLLDHELRQCQSSPGTFHTHLSRAPLAESRCYGSGTLWLGNAAYLYLSVSFIQMLKALMPVAVFGVGCGLGTESYNHNTMLNMVIVTIGVAIASYGEINFVVLGVLLQLAAVLTESSRLTLVRLITPTITPCWVDLSWRGLGGHELSAPDVASHGRAGWRRLGGPNPAI